MGKAAGERLKDWLKDGGRTITWLAKTIPVDRSHLYQWLNDTQKPSAVYQHRIEQLTDGAIAAGEWGQ